MFSFLCVNIQAQRLDGIWFIGIMGFIMRMDISIMVFGHNGDRFKCLGNKTNMIFSGKHDRASAQPHYVVGLYAVLILLYLMDIGGKRAEEH